MNVNPITYQVIRGGLINACREAGIVLRNSAFSPNIKERMDHSTAILSPKLELVAQAEHIPVHLGSISWGVRNTMALMENVKEGDMIIVNDPYIAGTHLPDILLIRPVFYEGKLIAFVANRAHHADVGGMAPGSMPGDASEIYHEGIIIPPVKIMEGDEVNGDILKLILANVRTPEERLGDIKAQISANRVLEKRVLELAGKYGDDTLMETMNLMLKHSERRMRRRISRISPGLYEGEDYIEGRKGNLLIKVAIRVEGDELFIDFSGTSKQVEEPINAVMGVTLACVLYILKAIADPSGAANDGYLRAAHVKAPKGTIVNAKPPAPVSGGNVETAQRIVDVLLRALADALPGIIPAASQGTMNNVSVGGYDEDGRGWTFYETIGGGMGARPGLDGIDCVHVHMTNTMNTPIEVLERYYPIRFLKYELRPDSGGAGKWRGGCGIERAWVFLGSTGTLSVMGNRVRTKPWGLRGGRPGASAEYLVVRRNGQVVRLGPMATIRLMKGDVVILRTPGGGGYGNPLERDVNRIIEDYLEGKVTKRIVAEIYGIGELEKRLKP
ncbi:MAG: hydantoinase B/oxoprolinase family protein [Thermoprotei archaeon]|nr:hydantoinase B/oxoprolinase family protein [Thermoprotei archaeon]